MFLFIETLFISLFHRKCTAQFQYLEGMSGTTPSYRSASQRWNGCSRGGALAFASRSLRFLRLIHGMQAFSGAIGALCMELSLRLRGWRDGLPTELTSGRVFSNGGHDTF